MGRRRGVGRLVAASGWTWLAGLQPGTGVLPLMRACLPSVVGRAMRHRYSLAACVLKQLTHAECQEHKASVLEARPLPHAPLAPATHSCFVSGSGHVHSFAGRRRLADRSPVRRAREA